MPLFGQGRELGEVYDATAPYNMDDGSIDALIDMMIMRGMSNDAIEDEIRNIETRGELNDMGEGSDTGSMFGELMEMRNASGQNGALGNVDPAILDQLVKSMGRRQMSPERIHNLGVLYGKPLSQDRINYFEDQMNQPHNQSYNGEFPQFPE